MAITIRRIIINSSSNSIIIMRNSSNTAARTASRIHPFTLPIQQVPGHQVTLRLLVVVLLAITRVQHWLRTRTPRVQAPPRTPTLMLLTPAHPGPPRPPTSPRYRSTISEQARISVQEEVQQVQEDRRTTRITRRRSRLRVVIVLRLRFGRMKARFAFRWMQRAFASRVDMVSWPLKRGGKKCRFGMGLICNFASTDNNMVNGTKLLNVCGMSRGKRDGILKNEKERIVVKVGAMHLKGVW